jgi:hypothetical protein
LKNCITSKLFGYSVEQTSERDCSYENEQKCTVKFVYGFDSNGARRVRVQREPICTDPPAYMAIGLGNNSTALKTRR